MQTPIIFGYYSMGRPGVIYTVEASSREIFYVYKDGARVPPVDLSDIDQLKILREIDFRITMEEACEHWDKNHKGEV